MVIRNSERNLKKELKAWIILTLLLLSQTTSQVPMAIFTPKDANSVSQIGLDSAQPFRYLSCRYETRILCNGLKASTTDFQYSGYAEFLTDPDFSSTAFPSPTFDAIVPSPAGTGGYVSIRSSDSYVFYIEQHPDNASQVRVTVKRETDIQSYFSTGSMNYMSMSLATSINRFVYYTRADDNTVEAFSVKSNQTPAAESINLATPGVAYIKLKIFGSNTLYILTTANIQRTYVTSPPSSTTVLQTFPTPSNAIDFALTSDSGITYIGCNGISSNPFLHVYDLEGGGGLIQTIDRSGDIGITDILYGSLKNIEGTTNAIVIASQGISKIGKTYYIAQDEGTTKYYKIDFDIPAPADAKYNYFISSVLPYNPQTGQMDLFISGIMVDTTTPAGTNDQGFGVFMRGTISPCHSSCATCSAAGAAGCETCPDGFKIKGGTSPNECVIDCDPSCVQCSVAKDSKKCTECKAEEVITPSGVEGECKPCETGFKFQDGKCVKQEEKQEGENEEEKKQEESITLAEKICGSLQIPGCEECSKNVSEGCSRCQKGAGIETNSGVSYCVVCPFKNCEKCFLTNEGRQCQKCFDGFKVDVETQNCEIAKGVFVILWLGVFLAFFYFELVME